MKKNFSKKQSNLYNEKASALTSQRFFNEGADEKNDIVRKSLIINEIMRSSLDFAKTNSKKRIHDIDYIKGSALRTLGNAGGALTALGIYTKDSREEVKFRYQEERKNSNSDTRKS